MELYPTEYEEQKKLVQYLELKRLKFTAIPNSTWTPSFAQKNKNRAMGLRAGFPDMIIVLPNNQLLFAELKRKKGGVVSNEQNEWIKTLKK